MLMRRDELRPDRQNYLLGFSGFVYLKTRAKLHSPPDYPAAPYYLVCTLHLPI